MGGSKVSGITAQSVVKRVCIEKKKKNPNHPHIAALL
jgi:type II secretory ATPase GspE/PulE/Tfp pilus assembly ATPase PilB-like protein